MRGSSRSRASLVLAAVAIGGCYQGLGNAQLTSDASPGADGADGADDGETGGPWTPESDCEEGLAGYTPLRRLTRTEYNNTVRDLLGTALSPADAFTEDELIGPFESNAVALVPELALEDYFDAAELLATDAVTDLEALLPCDPAAEGDEACAREFIHSFGRRAYRRPLAAADVERVYARYARGREGATFADGVRVAMQMVLQSPHFLYHLEVGGPDGHATDLEVASRLSYFLWRSMPDEELLAQAEKGLLSTADQIAEQARRLLEDDRARGAMLDFARQWLGLRGLELSKAAPAQREQLELDALAIADTVLWNGDGFLVSLLTSGVLTGPGFLTAHNDVTPRGLFVRNTLLCDMVQTPPGFDPEPAEPQPGLSPRESWNRHVEDTGCASCHAYLDPPGFAFDHYDELGGWRDVINDRWPVDASGELIGTDVDGPFDGADELVELLAGSEDVLTCFADRMLGFAVARELDAELDGCTMASLRRAFVASGGDIRELMVGLTRSDAFRLVQRTKGKE